MEKRATIEQEAVLLRSVINELYEESKREKNHGPLIRRLLTEAEGLVELATRLLYR